MIIKLTRLKDKRTSDVLYFPIVESLAFGYLAANLRKNNLDAEIIDEEVQDISRANVIKKLSSADLIGFTATSKPQIYEILKVIPEIRKINEKTHITIGGHFATFLYKELLSLRNIFDSVVLYEGEKTFVELAKFLEKNLDLTKVKGIAFKKKNKIIKNELRSLIKNLDGLPFPARDLLPEIIKKGGLVVLSSSRGCYNKCSYCTISQFYNDPPGIPFRLRSAENVIKELKELKLNFPQLRDVWFVDDNFVIPGEKGFERTKKLCYGIKSLGLKFDIYLRANDVDRKILKLLKESGIRSIFIGAESGCDRTLKKIFNKNITSSQTKKAVLLCKKFNIGVDPGFIMFHPWSTLKEIEKNIKFLDEIGVYSPYGIASFLTTYKFTPIGKEMISGKRKYKNPRVLQKDIFLDDVPYEIRDCRVELLLDTTLIAFQNFNEIPRALFQLKRITRVSGKRSLEKQYTKRVVKFSKLAIKYFKMLFYYIKHYNMKSEEIRAFLEKVKSAILRDSKKEVEKIESLILSNSQISQKQQIY